MKSGVPHLFDHDKRRTDPNMATGQVTGKAPPLLAHTGLRGLAAMAVIAAHLPAPHLLIGGSNRALSEHAYIFVDLFFILSGFVMCHSYGERLIGSRPGKLREFFVARIARLVPLHVFALLWLGVLATLTAWAQSRFGERTAFLMPIDGGFWQQLLLLNIWHRGHELVWNFPSWSISAEAHVYLVLPLLIYALRYRALMGALLAGALLFYGMTAAETGSLDLIDIRALPRAGAGFVVGMALYAARQRLTWSDAVASAIQIGCVMTIGAYFVVGYNDVAVIAVFAALVASTWADRGAVAHMLRRPIAIALGERSYSIYLMQIPVLTMLGTIQSRLHLARTPAVIVAENLIAVVAILSVAVATYRWIERPARDALRIALDGRRGRPIEAEPAAP